MLGGNGAKMAFSSLSSEMSRSRGRQAWCCRFHTCSCSTRSWDAGEISTTFGMREAAADTKMVPWHSTPYLSGELELAAHDGGQVVANLGRHVPDKMKKRRRRQGASTRRWGGFLHRRDAGSGVHSLICGKWLVELAKHFSSGQSPWLGWRPGFLTSQKRRWRC